MTMMKSSIFSALLLAVLLLASCQSNTWKVEGTASGIADGDTILLYDGISEFPLDTIVVQEGKFELEGQADSVMLYTLYCDKASQQVIMFFTEPGTIKISLADSEAPVVSGTPANDAWQEFVNLQMDYSQKMQEKAMNLYNENVAEDQRMAIYQQYIGLQNEMNEKVIQLIKDNLGNEMGYYLFVELAFSGELFTNEQIVTFIGMMPEKFKQREPVKTLENRFGNAGKTEVGKTIENFTLRTPDGESMDLRSEISKNKITVLDFWASWCGPCCEEMPFMKQMLEENQEKGLGIIGISLDQDNEDWTNAIARLGLTWPQAIDDEGKLAEAFLITAIPYTVILDQNGVILAKELRREALSQFIKEKLED